jgi:hypothetical protein
MKYLVLNGNFVFDLCDFFHECNPGIKRELPVLSVLNQHVLYKTTALVYFDNFKVFIYTMVHKMLFVIQ